MTDRPDAEATATELSEDLRFAARTSEPNDYWRELLEKAATALAAPVSPSGAGTWQPIETAPKDGTRILVLVLGADIPPVNIARWSEVDDCWLLDDDFSTVVGSGWQPLPAPPTPTTAQEP